MPGSEGLSMCGHVPRANGASTASLGSRREQQEQPRRIRGVCRVRAETAENCWYTNTLGKRYACPARRKNRHLGIERLWEVDVDEDIGRRGGEYDGDFEGGMA